MHTTSLMIATSLALLAMTDERTLVYHSHRINCSVGTWIEGFMFPRYTKQGTKKEKRQRRYTD